MKKIIALVALSALGTSYAAYASCEDGQAMAEDAAVSVAKKSSSGCKADSSTQLSDSNGKERWQVTVKCSSFHGADVYEVRLQEMEDAACFVSSTKLLESQE